jgi:hypothetical protein
MVTDAQVELVARRYCVLRGIDPNRLVPTGGKPNPLTGLMTLELRHVPAWTAVAEFVRQRAAMDEAFQILDITPSPFPVPSPSSTTDDPRTA